MSLYCNGVITQRGNTRIRSLGGDHLPGQINHEIDESSFIANTPDYHKSSLLSTSTKSTTVDSPPPRCVSFPSSLPGRENITEPIEENGIQNNAYRKDSEDMTSRAPRAPNGSAIRSLSAGSRLKRNGIIYPMNAPRVTVTAEVANENDLAEDATENVNNNVLQHKLNVPSEEYNESTDAPVTNPNKPLTIAEG